MKDNNYEVLKESLHHFVADRKSIDDFWSLLSECEKEHITPEWYRDHIRAPILIELASTVGGLPVTLDSGVSFMVEYDGRIEKSIYLREKLNPTHLWEPQTSKLISAIVETRRGSAIFGGAYIGDHVLLAANQISQSSFDGKILAFEPFDRSFNRLRKNISLNNFNNIEIDNRALWSHSGIKVNLTPDNSEASTVVTSAAGDKEQYDSSTATIDEELMDSEASLIMLDTEGAELEILKGAEKTLSRPKDDSVDLIFEIHKEYCDWGKTLKGVSVVDYVISKGYTVFGLRDINDNFEMNGYPIELVPLDGIYLDGPSHGFNLFATKRDLEQIPTIKFEIVKNVSPKYLRGRTGKLHQPVHMDIK